MVLRYITRVYYHFMDLSLWYQTLDFTQHLKKKKKKF